MHEIIKLRREWSIGRALGSGGFGRVYLAQASDYTSAVVKLVPKDPGAHRELLFEDLEGVPNVVPILDRGEWQDYWVLIMPRADKSLREYLAEIHGHLSVDDAIGVMADVGKALMAIEGRIVHRDVKPDNILLLDGHWCLADFGISRYAEATTALDTRKYALTPAYAAPEQWRGERASTATDVYALGVVAYELLVGERPFLGPEVCDYRRQHLEDVPGPISDIPPMLQATIDTCLYKRRDARPRPERLLAQLNKTMHATSEPARRLQQANVLSVQRQAEAARQQSLAKSEAERRRDLGVAADQSLGYIVTILNDQVMTNAPACERTGPMPRRSWILNEATLSLERSRVTEQLRADTRASGLPFEVVTYSSINLRIRRDRFGYAGRSHSLWYCDAQHPSVFRWYETAFMISSVIPERSSVNPFAVDPDSDAALALSPAISPLQVAWPFSPIDQGDEADFIDRWIGWFADAVQGHLVHPSSMPEQDPSGSWRKSALRLFRR